MNALLTFFRLLPAIMDMILALDRIVNVRNVGPSKLKLVLDTVTQMYNETNDLQKALPLEKLLSQTVTFVARFVGLLKAVGLSPSGPIAAPVPTLGPPSAIPALPPISFNNGEK